MHPSTIPIPSLVLLAHLIKAKKPKQRWRKTTTMTCPTNNSASVQLGLLIDQLINWEISRSPLPLQRLLPVSCAVSCVCVCVCVCAASVLFPVVEQWGIMRGSRCPIVTCEMRDARSFILALLLAGEGDASRPTDACHT